MGRKKSHQLSTRPDGIFSHCSRSHRLCHGDLCNGEVFQAWKHLTKKLTQKTRNFHLTSRNKIRLCPVSRWQAALELLEGASKATLEPDAVCFNAAISACGKSGEWQAALALLTSMWAKSALISVVMFWFSNHFPGKNHVFSQFFPRFFRTSPDHISYNAALAALSKGGLWPRALALLQRSRRFANRSAVCKLS